jgi:three-Cys-motif partner protein
VLRAYLERYVSVLTARIQQDAFRLTLIDGFAGGGRYLDALTKEERPGSPLVMLEAMEEAAEGAQKIRMKPFHLDVRYIFIEKDRESFDYLRQVLAESKYAPLIDDTIQLIHGEFTGEVSKVVASVKKRGRAGRAIFVLDQFGYSAVPLPTIRDILATLENAEIILTFATDSLIDYLGENEESQKILSKVGIALPSKDIRTAKAEREWRRAIQFALHRQIPEKTDAKFYTPFFIRSADAHRDFWLVHLSGHFRARDVMVGLHWQHGTSFAHYGGSGLRMLGYDQRYDADWTSQRMLPGFFFDQTALVSSQEELLEQLPERIFEFDNGVPFSELFSKLTNDCPVTAEIMKGVLRDLAKQGIIKVKDKTGAKSRRLSIQHDSDIIIPSRQTRLFQG